MCGSVSDTDISYNHTRREVKRKLKSILGRKLFRVEKVKGKRLNKKVEIKKITIFMGRSKFINKCAIVHKRLCHNKEKVPKTFAFITTRIIF